MTRNETTTVAPLRALRAFGPIDSAALMEVSPDFGVREIASSPARSGDLRIRRVGWSIDGEPVGGWFVLNGRTVRVVRDA